MNKKVLMVMALSVALVGCQQKAEQTANKAAETANKAIEATNNAKNKVEEKVEEAKGEEKSDAVTAATHENIKVTPENAVDKFKSTYSDAQIETISLEDRDGKGYSYKIEGANSAKEFEVEVDPVSGDIIKQEEKDASDNDGFIDETLISKIKEFTTKAIEDAGRDKYYNTAWDVSMDDGVAVIEIELKGHDTPVLKYQYNLQTGDLIEKGQD